MGKMMALTSEARQPVADDVTAIGIIDDIQLSLAKIKAASELVAGVLGVNPEMEYGVSIRTMVETIYWEADAVGELMNEYKAATHKQPA